MYYLQRGYNFEEGYWEDLGARAIGANPGAARSFYFEDTDTLTLLQSVWDDDTKEYVYIAIDTLQYGEIQYGFSALPSGQYAMRFVMEDVFRSVLYSDYCYFTIQDGTMYYE